MLGFGLTVAVIGIGIVFSALVFLILVIKVMTMAVAASEAKAQPATVSPVKKTEAPAAVPVNNETAQDESEVMAVIAAAVASLSQGRMVVKTITRLPGLHAPAWSYAGRTDVMSARQL